LSDDPNILLLTSMRNEGPFVVEWLAHHRALGASSALVFSNDCDDGTDGLLDALAAQGVVEHIRQNGGGKSVQWRALTAAKSHPLYEGADWVLGIDCDEFVTLKTHDTLPALLTETEGDAVTLVWRFFGAAGQLNFDTQPVTERFLRAAPEDMIFPAAARFFKTLYRPSAFARPGVHRPKAKPSKPAVWLDGSGAVLPKDFALDDGRILAGVPPGRDLAQLNHYSLRAVEDFMVKRRRGLPNRSDKALDASYWAERNFNTVEDRSAARHWEARRAEATRLMALPGVAQGHEACVTAHRARIAQILSDPLEARLFTRLALLTESAPPSPEATRRLLDVIARARG
jgi:hypothetical protein